MAYYVSIIHRSVFEMDRRDFVSLLLFWVGKKPSSLLTLPFVILRECGRVLGRSSCMFPEVLAMAYAV